MDRKPLFLDPDTGLVTETSSSNTIDLSTMPWLEKLIVDLGRCKQAFKLLDIDIAELDPDL